MAKKQHPNSKDYLLCGQSLTNLCQYDILKKSKKHITVQLLLIQSLIHELSALLNKII